MTFKDCGYTEAVSLQDNWYCYCNCSVIEIVEVVALLLKTCKGASGVVAVAKDLERLT